MKEKQVKTYKETRPLVKVNKRGVYDAYFEYTTKNNQFEEFQKVSYAIRLISKGINEGAFRPMFADKPAALRFAGELADTQELER